MAVELTRLHLTDLSQVRIKFFRCPLSFGTAMDVLFVKCDGKCNSGAEGKDDCAFIAAMARAGLAAWRPVALVFDFSELAYECGDAMLEVLRSGEGEFIDDPFPTVVVVSSLSRNGLTILIEQEMGDTEKAENWLVDSTDAALNALEIKCRLLFGDSGEYLIS